MFHQNNKKRNFNSVIKQSVCPNENTSLYQRRTQNPVKHLRLSSLRK